jgi:exopolysaccharide production protein ExoZ
LRRRREYALPAMKPIKTAETIASIQVLRAVAVLVVTICHAEYEVSRIGSLPSIMPSAALENMAGFGVQLFFVISGFVMVYATEPLFGTTRGPLIFLERRLARIVPLYWIVTTFYLTLTLLVAGFGKQYPASFVIASYLFLPAARPDGVVEPLVGQGWSLNYEMLFYFVFALTVSNARRVSVSIVTAVLISAVVIGQIAHPLPFVVSVWTAPLLLYFVFGMWIGLAYREGLTLTPIQGLLLIIAGCILLFIEIYWPPESLIFGLICWTIPALIVAGSSLPRLSLSAPFWTPLMVVGAASYALYLFHAVPIRGFLYLARWNGFDIGRASGTYLCTTELIAIALAIAIYYWVERPLLRALRWRSPPRQLDVGTATSHSPIALLPDLKVSHAEERV